MWPRSSGFYIVHTALDNYRKHESRCRVPKAYAMDCSIKVIVVSFIGSVSLARQDYEVHRRYLGDVSVGLRVKSGPVCKTEVNRIRWYSVGAQTDTHLATRG